MIDFNIWNMKDTGLVVQCLICNTTFGLETAGDVMEDTEAKHYRISTMEDSELIFCPMCKNFLTGAEIKAILLPSEVNDGSVSSSDD